MIQNSFLSLNQLLMAPAKFYLQRLNLYWLQHGRELIESCKIKHRIPENCKRENCKSQIDILKCFDSKKIFEKLKCFPPCKILTSITSWHESLVRKFLAVQHHKNLHVEWTFTPCDHLTTKTGSINENEAKLLGIKLHLNSARIEFTTSFNIHKLNTCNFFIH